VVAGEMAEPVGVVVVGGGPGGYTAAARAAELGRDVVLVEEGDLGGVCLNVGCIPSKVFTAAAHDLARAEAGPARGIRTQAEIDMPLLQAWRKQVVDRLVGGVGALLSRVRVVPGTAYFLDAHRISVEHGDHVSYFRFEHAIVATGSEPVGLPGLAVDGDRVLDSTGVLALAEVPARLAVVGGGYIGAELGMAFARFGSAVSIVEATDRILGGFDQDLVEVVLDRASALGIDVRTGTTAQRLTDDGLLVRSGQAEEVLPADRVLVAVGRRPRSRDLQLEDLGVTLTPAGHVVVDEQQRTTVPHVFAIGDVTEGPALAHKASAEGRVAAEVACGLPSGFDAFVPLIAFTEPELASVGLTEEQARTAGHDVVVGRSRFSTSGRAVALGEDKGLVKVVVDAGTDVVLGMHLVGPAACDLIGEGALAVETASRAEDLLGTVHPHPTLVETIHSAVEAARRRAAASAARRS
jgi:dihydrolipoamide dehydrogenase